MDADYRHGQREQVAARRNSSWSMNSQRLEAVVAELMKPISDARRNFDMDLSSLLECYLTEAGLHALDADDDVPPPNFSELALLLQQSASIYSRKVDYLYQHVLEVSDSLLNSTREVEPRPAAEADGLAVPVGDSPAEGAAMPARRRRKESAAARAGEFVPLSVAAAAGARRGPDAARPPPSLPRVYLELEPRAAASARDPPLLDLAGEPIGLLADFHLTWRLHEGLLVDDLQGAYSHSESDLSSISLVELQAAIAAAVAPPPALLSPDAPPAPLLSGAPPAPLLLGAPPAPLLQGAPPAPLLQGAPPAPLLQGAPPAPLLQGAPPAPLLLGAPPAPLLLGEPPAPGSPGAGALSPPGSPLRASTPLPAPELPPATPATPTTPATPKHARHERKRRSTVNIDDFVVDALKLVISDELLDQLSEMREFSIPSKWIAKVVSKRKRHILSERQRLRAEADALSAGFAGWSGSEAAAAVAAAAARCKTFALELESDDDGFFDQSSLLENDASGALAALDAQAAWQERVLARAAAGAAAGVDVRELGARVLAALAAPAPQPAPFPHLLARAARAPPDVSRLLLATLFLANAGNVEIIPGAPLSVNSFSVRVLSTDERLFGAAVLDDQFLR